MENKISAPAVPVADVGASSVHRLPWRAQLDAYAGEVIIYNAVEHHASIARLSLYYHGAEEQQANAAYIVRCVNAHEALVEALRALVENADEIEHDSYALQGCEDFQPREALATARAALKLATE